MADNILSWVALTLLCLVCFWQILKQIPTHKKTEYISCPMATSDDIAIKSWNNRYKY